MIMIKAFRYYRAGKHLFKQAQAHGWNDDGEGAFEFLTRQVYRTACEDFIDNNVAVEDIIRKL